MTSQYTIHLQNAGLTEHEAALYETLVTGGAQPASKAARAAKVPRTLAYKVLADLEQKGLIERDDKPKAVSVFTAVHPQKLKESIEEERKRAKHALTALNDVLPELTSAYNLAIDKPGVRFYEGPLGVQRVLDDSLTSREEIRSYADADAVQQYLPEINAAYMRARASHNVSKRVILPARARSHTFISQYTGRIGELTSTRYADLADKEFGTVMQIYDNKVSYITMRDEKMIGVIIEDKFIYEMHKTVFDYMWATCGE